MGIKLGGGGLPNQSDLTSVDASGPSGRLQVFEPKDFPYLNTGKSLVFVIARNGMIWGKRLDKQSSKGDIELEVFWPKEDGCLIRIVIDAKVNVVSNSVPLCVLNQRNDFTIEQKRRIESILSQKEIIQYELGTLMVRPFPNLDLDWRSISAFHRKTDKCILDFMHGEPCNIKVINCPRSPNEYQSSLNLSSWNFYYDDAAIDFKFFSDSIYKINSTCKINERLAVGTSENPVRFADIQNIESRFDSNGAVIVKVFFASRLSEKKFDMSSIKLRNNIKIKPSLRIMYGEYDFFEYFDIDDAVLVLEEETISAGLPKLSWTLGIAQNKHVREMMRLASNNSGLFAPLIPK